MSIAASVAALSNSIHTHWKTRQQRRHDMQAWSAVTSLDDLGDLTAAWLTGHIAYHPGYPGHGPDPETHAIAPTLARACLAGYVTTNSQPEACGTGVDGRWWRQRAWVEGLATPDALDDLRVALSGSGMVMLTHSTPRPWWQPQRAYKSALPITSVTDLSTDDAAEHVTWGGYWPSTSDIAAAAFSGCDATHVTVIDPDWSGRPSPLWGLLDQAFQG